MRSQKLEEGKDYYVNKQGLVVLTKQYLLKRGSCCHNKCTHCPYKECHCHKKIID